MTLSALRRLALLSVALPLAAGVALPGWAATITVPPNITTGVVLNAGDSLEVGSGGSVTKGSGSAVTSSPVVAIDHVTVATGGSITGVGGSAVAIDGGLTTFSNAGTISGTSNSQGAVDIAADSGSFTNSGSITATGNNGVYVHGSSTTSFLNDTGGTISSNSDQTTRVTGTTASFVNKGTIISTNTDTNGAGSVFGGKVTTFANNSGASVQAVLDGVRLSGGLGSGTNGGIITVSGATGRALVIGQDSTGVATDSGSFTNSGTIEGHDAVIYRDLAKAASFTNSGTIVAHGGLAIGMTAEGDNLTLMTGSTTTGTVDGRAGSDTLTLDGVGTSTLDIGQFTNFETFSKLGAGKWTLSGNYAGAMTATVGAGDLRINGAMGSTNFTLNGGILGGIGTVGTIAANNGAHVAPGNSVGTLNSASITFAAGSVFDVEVAGSVADKLVVTGTANLTGGTINVTGSLSSCGNLSLPILTTTGGRSGEFTLGSMLASTSISYDANNVYLDIAGGAGRTFTGFTDTANQASTATALDALGCGNQPYSVAINALTDAEVPAAMDALSGEGHAAIAGALLEGSHFLSDTIEARIDQAFEALDTRGVVTNYAAGPMLLDAVENITVWGSGYGGFASQAGNGNASATQSAASGFVVGADGKVTADWRMGLLGGLGLTGISAGATSGKSLDASIGGYAGAELGIVTVKAGAAYTRHFIDTSRSIVFPGVNDVVTASYQAGTAQAFLEVSKDFDVEGVTVTPFAKFQAVSHATDAFTETGGAGGALSTAASVANALFVTLGVGAEDKFALGDTMLVTARGSIGWRHAFADNPTVANSFASGGPFMISAIPVAQDVAVLTGGLIFDINEAMNLSVTYEGALGSGFASSAVKATLAGRF